MHSLLMGFIPRLRIRGEDSRQILYTIRVAVCDVKVRPEGEGKNLERLSVHHDRYTSI